MPPRRYLIILLALVPCAAVWAQWGLDQRPAFSAFNGGTLPPNASTVASTYNVVPAFPNLPFTNPMGIVQKPGTNTMIVWEREGRVYAFDRNANASTKTLLLDISARCQGWDDSGLMSMAFHPDFASNGYVFIYYTWVPTGTVQGAKTVRPPTNKVCYDHLARFTMRADGTIDPNSELVLIHQKSYTVWHNGSGMFFHPVDGFLYVVNGDDYISTNAQQITKSLHSGVLRIDVDQRGGSISHAIITQPGPVGSYTQNYFIPNSNPFVGRAGVLEEFYAIGLRSPHRMTRDDVTGRIFISDVGDESREEINVIEPGDMAANFQWPRFEGLVGDMTQPYLGLNKKPVIDYSHSDGQAVIGGYVYRGTVFPELVGKYIFGDNMVGTIWYLDETTTPATKVAIAKLPNGPGPIIGESYVGLSSFGVDADNELYLCQLSANGGRIYKLTRNGAAPTVMPATLSATGVFSDLQTLRTNSGFLSYEVNSPLWSDGALKQRWFAVPSGQKIGYAAEGEWTFPQGSVFVKHFELNTDEADTTQRRRLETRVLVRDDQGYVYGGTYRWHPDNSEADLVSTTQDEDITIKTADGSTRTQRWTYPGRQECLTCHTVASKGVLGLNTPQSHRDHAFTETSFTDDQLRAWNHAGFFAPAIDEASLKTLTKLAALDDATASVEMRVRSYLDSNCSHCHRPGGGARGNWDGRIETALDQAGIVNGAVVNTLGEATARVVKPQDVLKSLIYKRMNTATEAYAMPPLGKHVVDTAAVSMLVKWIGELPLPPLTGVEAPWQPAQLGGSTKPKGGVGMEGTTIVMFQQGFDPKAVLPTAPETPAIFVGQPMTGDGQLMVRLDEGNAPAGELALMIRETLADGAKRVQSPPFTGLALPYWLKLRRAGNVFTASSSKDGLAWTAMPPVTMTMAAKTFIGIWHSVPGTGRFETLKLDKVQFMPTVPWLITMPPQSLLVRAGQVVDFSVETTGDTPTSYQWRKTNVNIARAVSSHYGFKAALASGGSYNVMLGGKLLSAAATLAVVDQATFATNLAPGATATFTLPVSGTGMSFLWSKGGVPLPATDTRILGARSNKLTVKLLTLNDIGDYECVVTGFGSTQVMGPYHLHVVQKPLVTAPAPPAGSVSHPFSWQLAANDFTTGYTVTGLPSGLTYNATTGLISGTPNVGGSIPIKVTAKNAAGSGVTVDYMLVIEVFPPAFVASFNGLVKRDALNQQLGGSITLAVSSSGVMTGKLYWAATSYPLGGRADFVTGTDPVLTSNITGSGTPPLVLTLRMNQTTGVISGDVGSVLFSAVRLLTAVDLAYVKAFNGTLYQPGSLVDPPVTALDPLIPPGYGWLRAVVSKTAAVTLSGHMADGAAITSSSTLTPALDMVVRQLLYANHGSVQGITSVSITPPAGGTGTSSFTGTLDWRKTGAASATDRTYPAPFAITNLGLSGAPVPAAVAGQNLLGKADAVDNAEISFRGAGIENVATNNLPNQTFQLTAANKAVFSANTAINPCKVNMTITASTGYFQGTMTLKDGTVTRTLSYRGAFQPGNPVARGAFTLVQLPGTTTAPILTGTVQIKARN